MCKLARLYGASGMQACWPSARPAFPETTGRTWGVLLKASPRLQVGRCEHLLPSPEDHHLTPTSHEASPTPQTQRLHMPCHSAYSFPLQLLPPRGQGFRPAALTVGMGHATQRQATGSTVPCVPIPVQVSLQPSDPWRQHRVGVLNSLWGLPFEAS